MFMYWKIFSGWSHKWELYRYQTPPSAALSINKNCIQDFLILLLEKTDYKPGELNDNLIFISYVDDDNKVFDNSNNFITIYQGNLTITSEKKMVFNSMDPKNPSYLSIENQYNILDFGLSDFTIS